MEKVLLSDLGWASVIIVENGDLELMECIPFMGKCALGQAKDFLKKWIRQVVINELWQEDKYTIKLFTMIGDEPHATNVLTGEEINEWRGT